MSNISKQIIKLVLFSTSILLMPSMGYCHRLKGTGFIEGITHPVLGIDHLLAMVSVGVVSAQMGGRAIWMVPTTFVSVMVLGGVLGMKYIGVPMVEHGIAISVIALGLAISLEKKMPILVSMGFVGFFALFHGHAHGTEMPHLGMPLFYSLGFVLGTASIHLGGVVIGHYATLKPKSASALRFAGAVIAGMGIQILIG